MGLRIGREGRDGLRRGGVVVRGDEGRGAVPELAEGGDVGEDEGAAVLGCFQHREAEGFVEGEGDEDGAVREVGGDAGLVEAAEGAGVAQRDLSAVGARERAGGEEGDRRPGGGAVEGRDVLRLVPEAAGGEGEARGKAGRGPGGDRGATVVDDPRRGGEGVGAGGGVREGGGGGQQASARP
jgi:hypothetical protein